MERSETAIFVFDGGDLQVFPSLTTAEGGLEVYDLDRYLILAHDGTVIRATAEGYRVRRISTGTEELQSRLRAYLGDPRVGLKPNQADEPLAAARALLDRQWADRRFRWLPWLDRRLNAKEPPRVAGG